MANEHPLLRALNAGQVRQQELADEANVPQPQISQVISGARKRFGPEAALRIVDFFARRSVRFVDDSGRERPLELRDLVLPYVDPVTAPRASAAVGLAGERGARYGKPAKKRRRR